MLGSFLSCTFSEALKRVFLFRKFSYCILFRILEQVYPTLKVFFFLFFFLLFFLRISTFLNEYTPFGSPCNVHCMHFYTRYASCWNTLGNPFQNSKPLPGAFRGISFPQLRNGYTTSGRFFCVMYPLRSAKEGLSMLELTAEYLSSSSETAVPHADFFFF